MARLALEPGRLAELRTWANDCLGHLHMGAELIDLAATLGTPGEPPAADDAALEWARFLASPDGEGAAARRVAGAELRACFDGLEALLDEYIGPRPAGEPLPASPAAWPQPVETLRRFAAGIDAHHQLIMALAEPSSPQPDPDPLLGRLAANAATVRAASAALAAPAALDAAVRALAGYLERPAGAEKV